MDAKIIVATHKPYWMPADALYLPVAVGPDAAASMPGFQRDNTGESIAEKNANYCELTALYWAWKNVPAAYLGLAHYRRHFAARGAVGAKKSRILTQDALAPLLQRQPVLLPSPRHYVLETNRSQYAHAHHAQDLAVTRDVLTARAPQEVDAFDRVMARRGGHRFNMFIMRRDLLDDYCAWLFEVLFAVEARLDISAYSANDARVFGFLGERLLDVWLEANQVGYATLPYVFLEKQNWVRKGGSFLRRKMRGGPGE